MDMRHLNESNKSWHQTLVNQAKIIIEENNRRRKLTASGYNVFEVLDRLRDETKGHSAFIAHLLNSKGNHSQGDVYLKAFLTVLFPEDTFNFEEDWAVVTEKTITEGDSSSDDLYGRIDIWIESCNSIIVVENKIDAVDQYKQLQRYINYARHVANGRAIYIVYLTPNGTEPSSESLGTYSPDDLIKDTFCYLDASYENHMYDWINECIKMSVELPTLRETLVQYRKTIRQIAGKVQEEELEMNLKEMLATKEDIIAALELGKAATEKLNELEKFFWDDLEKGLNGMLAASVQISRNDRIAVKYYGLSFMLDRQEDSELRLRVERDKGNDNIYIGFYQSKTGNPDQWQRGKSFAPVYKDVVSVLNGDWHSNQSWLRWVFVDVGFSVNSENPNYIGYVDTETRARVVHSMLDAIRNIIDDINAGGTLSNQIILS